jgi:2'-5' RNA ligase
MRLDASIRLPPLAASRLEAVLLPEFAETSQLAWAHPSHWTLMLARFGNVVQSDGFRLADLLTEQVAQIPAPTLRISGVVALPEDGDDGVWAEVTGDVDTASDLASAIPRWVLEFGFVPDRRAYRSRIQLGKITPTTTAGYLESLIDRVGSFEGDAWTPDGVTLGYIQSATDYRVPELHEVAIAYFAGITGRHVADRETLIPET